MHGVLGCVHGVNGGDAFDGPGKICEVHGGIGGEAAGDHSMEDKRHVGHRLNFQELAICVREYAV